MSENEISYIIRGAIYTLYNELGPGLLESVYCKALVIELREQDLIVETEVGVCAKYKGMDLGVGLRLDILVENKVIIEVKSVETLLPVHHKQAVTYLKTSGLKLAILVNFNEDEINDGIFRKVNKL